MSRSQLIVVLLLLFGLSGLAADFARPRAASGCYAPECGNGPKDKKCPDGYVCKDGRCVKK